MRAVRRADWFSVVATDLFCGALGAVIILDAATPKNPRATEGPGALVMSYYAKDCQKTLVVARLSVTGAFKLVSSVGSEQDSDTCRKFIDLQELDSLTIDRVLLAKGPNHLDVQFEVQSTSGLGPWVCSTKTGECR
jgi:hypothetical protein